MWSDLAVTRMVSDLDDYEDEEEEEDEGRADYGGGNGSSLSLRINRAPVIDVVASQEEEKRKASRKEEEDIIQKNSGSSNASGLEGGSAPLKVKSDSVNIESAGEPMDISTSSSLHLNTATEHPVPAAEIKADVTNQTANHSSSVVVPVDSGAIDTLKDEKEVGGWTICAPNDYHHSSIGSLNGQNSSDHSESAALLLPLPPLYTGGATIGTKRFSSMMLKSAHQRPKISRLHTTGCTAIFGSEY